MTRTMISLLALFAASPAFAHHAMGGATPQTVWHGLLSGLAHPVIGLDHLTFVALAGMSAALAGRRFTGALAFVAATLVGAGLHLGGVELPLAELVIAFSLVILAGLLLMRVTLSGMAALAGFTLAGVFHGWAYGEAVVGAEPAPIIAYLIGFGVIQSGIAWGAANVVAQTLIKPTGAARTRIAVAICLGIGIALVFSRVPATLLG